MTTTATAQTGGLVRLSGAGVRALGLIGVDAVRDRVGGALPATPEALAHPEVLTELLGTPVRAARLVGVDFESSNCRNFLVEVEWDDGSVETLYAKLPARELAVRAFANTFGFWNLECTFAAHVAEHVPVRVPRVHAAIQRGSRFVLLLENLRELPGARLFLNRDMAAGTTVEQARSCLTTFAELHAGFHGWDAPRRDALLPMALHPYLPQRRRAMTRVVNGTAVARARKRAPKLVRDHHVALVRYALDHWDALIDHWYSGPLTLVHGDSHLANCFEYATPNGPRVGLLDFQAVHWSVGIRDVAYFLIHSLEPDLLAAHEDPLINHYLAELSDRGIEFDAAQIRAQYATFAFQPLMVGLVAVGLGGFTEREETMRTMLHRELAAIDRLEVGDAIERAVAKHS